MVYMPILADFLITYVFCFQYFHILQGDFILIKTFTINSGQKPTPEQLQEVENAKKYPIEFDEDCEELSPAMVKAFKASVVHRNRKKNA